MKVTWSWLAEFVELEQSIATIVERLTMSGLEVESVEEIGRDIAAVTCAEVVETRRHPNAERLTVCDVRIGDELVTVVCGAPNVRAGLHTAYARPGTVLPGGRRIEAAEIRGIASAGMLCSEAELGLGDANEGIVELASNSKIGERVARVLGYEDTVLDVAITPNRGDCLSVLGIARDIAALSGQRLRRQRVAVTETTDSAANLVTIEIRDPDLCHRYVGRVLTDVTIGPAPLWMQYRLQAVGIRPINNVVDITNYVMLERGQPLHAFDYDCLPVPEIVVRRVGAEQRFTTLDTQERALSTDDLTICAGDDIIAIAGVMGGASTEVTEATRRVLLESAWFLPSSIRRTSRRLGLRSEASYRFERCTDVEGVALAADRAASLMVQHAGARVASSRVDVYPAQRPVAPIALRLARANDLLGMNLSRTDVTTKLKALGMSVTPATRGTVNVVAPSFRTDVTREIDLIEEIVRITGYENVPTTLPECGLSGAGESLDRRRLRQLREGLTALGLTEALPLSFCSQRLNQLFPGLGEPRRPVSILNPISQDDVEMRLSLGAGLIRAARHNADQATSRLALFAVGKVFWQQDTYREANRLAGVVSRAIPAQGLGMHDTLADFSEVKGIVEGALDMLSVADATWEAATDVPSFHPGKSARIIVDGTAIGTLGALHPAVVDELDLVDPCWLFELDLEKLLKYGRAPVIFKELQRFPAVIRDVAVLAESHFASACVVQLVRNWRVTQPLVEDIVLFDQYDGPPIPPGKKSLAFSISYRASDRTLTDTEINDVHSELKRALIASLPVELR